MASVLQSEVRTPRELDRLGSMTDVARQSARRVQQFIDRFHGNEQSEPEEPTDEVSHATQLERLNVVLDRLHKLTGELGSIG